MRKHNKSISPKKLDLHTQTIRNLGAGQLADAAGGIRISLTCGGKSVCWECGPLTI